MSNHIAIMIKKALSVLDNAYAPYSNFRVACCISDEKGNIYSGVNVENQAYGLACCAEMSAIAMMVTQGGRVIKNVVVLSSSNELCTPCGSCRQRLFEFSTDDTTIYMCNKNEVLLEKKLTELLPYAFKL